MMKQKMCAWALAVVATSFAVGFFGCTMTSQPVPQDETPVAVQENVHSELAALQPLSIQVNYVYRSGGTGPLLPITNGEELNSGDHYKIFFRVSQDCYVYIYQTDEAGQIERLFPIDEFDGVLLNQENPAKASAGYTLPTEDRFFYLDDTIGKETIFFIASLEPDLDLERLQKRMTDTRLVKDDKRITQTRQDIIAYLDNQGIDAVATTQTVLVAWMAGETMYPIAGHQFESLKQDSVHTIEFMHR